MAHYFAKAIIIGCGSERVKENNSPMFERFNTVVCRLVNKTGSRILNTNMLCKFIRLKTDSLTILDYCTKIDFSTSP